MNRDAFDQIISTARRINAAAERLSLLRNATVVNPTKFGARGDGETDDSFPFQTTLNAAAGLDHAIIDLGGKSYLVSRILNYNAPLSNIATFTNGRIVRKPGFNVACLQLMRGGSVAFRSDFVLDGNNRAEPSNNRMRSCPLLVHNVRELLFEGRVKDATSYGICGFQQGGPGRETRTFAVQNAIFDNCWEGGLFVFDVGADDCEYRINKNKMVLNIHPNAAAFPIQGPNGIGFECEDLPDIGTIKTVGKIVAEDNDIAINGSLVSNAYGICLINAPNVPARLNIRESQINRNRIYPLTACQKIAVPIFWLSPWLFDRGTQETCTVQINDNDLQGKMSSALVRAVRGDRPFPNTRFQLKIDGNKDRGGLASNSFKSFQIEGTW